MLNKLKWSWTKEAKTLITQLKTTYSSARKRLSMGSNSLAPKAPLY